LSVTAERVFLSADSSAHFAPLFLWSLEYRKCLLHDFGLRMSRQPLSGRLRCSCRAYSQAYSSKRFTSRKMWSGCCSRHSSHRFSARFGPRRDMGFLADAANRRRFGMKVPNYGAKYWTRHAYRPWARRSAGGIGPAAESALSPHRVTFIKTDAVPSELSHDLTY